MNNINPAHLRCRLNIDQAIVTLEEEYHQCNTGSLKLLFIYGFDSFDRLVWGQVIKSDDPLSSLEFIISLTKDFVENLANSDIYFLIKNSEYQFDVTDTPLGLKDFLDAYSDLAGTMEMVKGFIKGWQEFDLKKNEDKPYLKRHMIEVINQKLGLPSLFSDDRMETESHIIKKNISAHTTSLTDKLPQINKGSLLLILNSNIFWKSLFFLLSLIFLIIFYNFSQNGRYAYFKSPNHTLYIRILDTRTGEFQSPYSP